MIWDIWVYPDYCLVGRNPPPVDKVNKSHYLQRFILPRWCRISSINSMLLIWGRSHLFGEPTMYTTYWLDTSFGHIKYIKCQPQKALKRMHAEFHILRMRLLWEVGELLLFLWSDGCIFTIMSYTWCGYIFAYARKYVLIFQWLRGFRRSCNFMTRPCVLGHVYTVYCCVHHVIHLDLHQDAWIKQTFVICFVIHTGTYWSHTYKHKCIHNTYTNIYNQIQIQLSCEV